MRRPEISDELLRDSGNCTTSAEKIDFLKRNNIQIPYEDLDNVVGGRVTLSSYKCPDCDAVFEDW